MPISTFIVLLMLHIYIPICRRNAKLKLESTSFQIFREGIWYILESI